MDEFPNDLLMVIIYHVLIDKWKEYSFYISQSKLYKSYMSGMWECRGGLAIKVPHDYIGVYKELCKLRHINKRFKNIISNTFRTIYYPKTLYYEDMYTQIVIDFFNSLAFRCPQCVIIHRDSRAFIPFRLFRCIHCTKINLIGCYFEKDHKHCCCICSVYPEHIHKLIPIETLELTEYIINDKAYDKISHYMNRLIKIYG